MSTNSKTHHLCDKILVVKTKFRNYYLTMVFKTGDRVLITRGMYKKHGTGTYIEPYGKAMAGIKVDGDSRDRRNLWLTSIEAMKRNNSTSKQEDVVVSREAYNELLDEISTLALALKSLELKVKMMDNAK